MKTEERCGMAIEYKRISDYSFGFERIQSGCRATYELSEEVDFNGGKTRYVLADFAYTFDHGPETMLFPCDEVGNVIDWGDLYVAYGDAVSDDSAVACFCECRSKR